MTDLSWIPNLLLPLLSTGGVIYLIADKLITSRSEKATASLTETQATDTSYKSLIEVIAALKDNIKDMEEKEDSWRDRYSDQTARLRAVQDELQVEISKHAKTRMLVSRAIIWIKDNQKNYCFRHGCSSRTPPNELSGSYEVYQKQRKKYKEENGKDFDPEDIYDITLELEKALVAIQESSY